MSLLSLLYPSSSHSFPLPVRAHAPPFPIIVFVAVFTSFLFCRALSLSLSLSFSLSHCSLLPGNTRLNAQYRTILTSSRTCAEDRVSRTCSLSPSLVPNNDENFRDDSRCSLHGSPRYSKISEQSSSTEIFPSPSPNSQPSCLSAVEWHLPLVGLRLGHLLPFYTLLSSHQIYLRAAFLPSSRF